jgi:Kef-type K+ transport system membrane component KefB
MEFRELLMGLALVWIAAKLAGEGMEHIGQTAVLGELLAGVLIGPGGRRLVHESEALHVLAELGVLILLFEVRLKSALDELLRAGAQATLVAVAGVALPLEFGFGVMRWFVTRPSWPFSSARRSPLPAGDYRQEGRERVLPVRHCVGDDDRERLGVAHRHQGVT